MTNSKRIIFALLASLTMAAAVWAAQGGQKPQMESGKISSIQKAGQGTLQDSFTLDITEEKTDVFFMVPQTKVDGPFKVGSKADVTYVFDKDGNKIAVTIKAT